MYRRLRVHYMHESVSGAVQEWLLHETYRSEQAITAFLEDATVDLVACSVCAAASGHKQLVISNTADFSPSCDFQVCSEEACALISVFSLHCCACPLTMLGCLCSCCLQN